MNFLDCLVVWNWLATQGDASCQAQACSILVSLFGSAEDRGGTGKGLVPEVVTSNKFGTPIAQKKYYLFCVLFWNWNEKNRELGITCWQHSQAYITLATVCTCSSCAIMGFKKKDGTESPKKQQYAQKKKKKEKHNLR